MEPFKEYGDSTVALEEEGDSGKRLTYGQVRRVSCSIAYTLRDRFGFRKGDVVLTCSENRIEFPVLFLGVAALGGATSGANPLYTHEEIRKQIEDSDAKYVVTTEVKLPVVLKAIDGLPSKCRLGSI